MMPIQADGELVPGVEEQTRQALVNMGHLLKAAGCDHRHVVKTTVLLKDIKDFPVVNDVYAEFFREDPPARATYQVLPLKQYVSVTVTCFPQRWELCPGLQVLKWRLLLWSAWLVFFLSSHTLLPSPVVTQKCRLSAQFQGQLLHSATGGEQQGDRQLLCRGRPHRRHLRRHHAQELETHLHLDSLLLC